MQPQSPARFRRPLAVLQAQADIENLCQLIFVSDRKALLCFFQENVNDANAHAHVVHDCLPNSVFAHPTDHYECSGGLFVCAAASPEAGNRPGSLPQDHYKSIRTENSRTMTCRRVIVGNVLDRAHGWRLPTS